MAMQHCGRFVQTEGWPETTDVCGQRLHGIFSSSRSSPNTHMTAGCHSGWRESTMVFLLCILNAFSWGDTSSPISEFGTVMTSPNTFGKCCSTIGHFLGHTFNDKESKPWCRAISEGTETTPPRSIRC